MGSADEKLDADLEAEWDAEIARRSLEIKDNTVTCRPAAEAIAEIRGKLDALRRQSYRTGIG